MDEEWRGVLGFPLYQVSSFGRVRRHPDHPSHLMSPALKPGRRVGGYPHVVLMRDGKTHNRSVHVLVCEAFHGPKPGAKYEVVFADLDRLNALPSNLSWMTTVESKARRKANGTHREGEAVSWARLKVDQIPKIRALLDSGKTVAEVARIYEVSDGAINGIKIERNWRSVPKSLPPEPANGSQPRETETCPVTSA